MVSIAIRLLVVKVALVKNLVQTSLKSSPDESWPPVLGTLEINLVQARTLIPGGSTGHREWGPSTSRSGKRIAATPASRPLVRCTGPGELYDDAGSVDRSAVT